MAQAMKAFVEASRRYCESQNIKHNKMKIEVGKYYKTRGGKKARIYAIDGGYSHSVHGAIQDDGVWSIMKWHHSGYWIAPHLSKSEDLISEWLEPLEFDPSCLPAWAEWIAMSEYGVWFWSVRKMAIIGPAWECPSCEDTHDIGYIPTEYAPTNYTGDWKDSLRKVSDL